MPWTPCSFSLRSLPRQWTCTRACPRAYTNGKKNASLLGGEDPLQPASRLGVQALKTARAFRRERQLFSFVRHQNVLAPSNAALWREHVTARVPADTDAAVPGAHARALRSSNQWIARWSRRWNVRRGFFKAAERLPLEAPRATAAFALPFGTPAEKRGSRKWAQKQARVSPAQGW
jgi:hypothetical protein